jgi:hypothetical protein
VVNAAIGFKPLFAVMKLGARQTMKSTAEKAGVPWSQNIKELEQSGGGVRVGWGELSR